jgi:hypothetical protein
MTQILAFQELGAEPEEGAFPCFGIAGSTITVHTE